MFSLPDQPTSLLDGRTRRELLRVGGLSLLGLTLSDLFRLQKASAGEQPKSEGRGPKFGKAKSIILFCTNGGTARGDAAIVDRFCNLFFRI